MSPARSSLVALAVLLVGACLQPRAVPCGDGWCPAGSVCTNGQCRDLSSCGDGVVSADEQCDEGAANSSAKNASCREDCTPARCGDGIVDDAPGMRPAEACDEGDGNSNVDPDACRESCVLPVCGDGIVDSGEERGCFEPATRLSTGLSFSHPVVRTADMDRDGLVDMVVGEALLGKVTVLYANPDGSWEPVDVPVSGPWKQLVLGDFDGVRGEDLAVMIDEPRQVEPFTSENRTWSAHEAIVENVFADAQLGGAGQLNDDVMDDLVVLGRRGLLPQGGVVEALESIGGGQFMKASTADYTGTAGAVAVASLFGEHRAQVIVVDTHDQEVERFATDRTMASISLALRPDPPPFPLDVPPGDGNIAMADLDGDPYLDLAIPQPSSVLVLRGLDDTFERRVEIDLDEPVSQICAGDIDADRSADLVVSHVGGHVRPIYFDAFGAPTLGKVADFAGAAGDAFELRSLQLTDLDRDSYLELVGVAEDRILTLRGGEGLFTRDPVLVSKKGGAVAVGDFDADGDMDLAINGNDVTWYENDGRQGFTEHVVAEVEVDELHAARLEGKPNAPSELVGYSSETGALVVWRLGANGALVETGRLAVSTHGRALVTDANEDGRQDVVLLDAANVLTVFLGEPSGTLAAPVTTALLEDHSLVYFELVDVDLDGHVDVVANSTDLVVYRGRGDGSFEVTPVTLWPGIYAAFTTGHFDTDGLVDFALVDRDTRSLEVLRGRGLETARKIQSQSLAEVPGVIFAGDFDGNGRTDLVLASTSVPTSVLLARKDGKMSSPVSLPAQREGGQALAADVNGDGRDDLLFVRAIAEEVQIFTSRTPTPRILGP